jgi:hypothetical protein
MDALPVDLLKQVHPVYGGAIGFGVWFGFQVWRAWKEYRKEQRDQRAAEGQQAARDAQRDEARAGRLHTGFAALDASRDKQIEQLTRLLNEEARRHLDEMARLDQRLAAKTAALLAVEQDRDRGWDLAREADDALHVMRHSANNLIQVAFAAGHLNKDIPPGIPPVPPLYSRPGKRPD